MSGVRFAPSPTGRFHIGNLRTAWISRKLALALDEPWVVRFEDIDGPRVLAGAETKQLADLAAIGGVPDGVYRQTARRARHWSLFVRAVAEGRLYPCHCSRKELLEALAQNASAPHRGGAAPIYNGHCRDRVASRESALASTHPTIAWRFREEDPSGAQDFVAARTAPPGAADISDLEASFIPGYHWACAIDDHDGAYQLLVRAWDLAPALTPQRAVHRWINGLPGESAPPPPAVFHTSLVTREDGGRLEKRTQGVTLPELVAAGWSPERIVACFEASFAVPSGWPRPGEDAGEPREAIRLSELSAELGGF